MTPLQIYGLVGIPEVDQHHDLPHLIAASLDEAGLSLRDGDVLVISSKVISKAQGLRADRSPRHEVIEAQSVRVVAERATPGGTTRIVESAAGPVMAAAGVDDSNTGPVGGSLVLPSDPDLAARSLYAGLLSVYAPAPLPLIGIVVSDTAGRPWREGQTDFALGACGVQVLADLKGSPDVDGRLMKVTARAVADEIAAAADLVKDKASGIPAALVRGLAPGTVASPGAAGAQSLLRGPDRDWFALGTVEAVRTALGAPPGSATAEHVGIPATALEPEQTRYERACRLALLGVEDRVDDDAMRRDQAHVSVRVDDPYLRGVVVTRLQVALHSEALGHWAVSGFIGSAGASVDPSGDRAGAC